MDAKLISEKLLSSILHPPPLLGRSPGDRSKLLLISLLAFSSLPFLFLGDNAYSRVSEILNDVCPKDFNITTEIGVFRCRSYDDFFVLWPPYESELRDFFACSHDSVFIDVGAHVGRYTVMVGKRVRRVVSIEPSSDNFDALRCNVALNNLRYITALRYACWEKAGTRLRLFRSSSPGKHSLLHPQSTSEVVDTVTLDGVLAGLGINPAEVGLVKIDAEGAEPQILKGAEKLLESGRPRVVFEAFPRTRGFAAGVLRSYGYKRIRRVGEINYVAEK